ncbi:MAG: hypothetical protein ABFC76_05995 [Fervidobacterium sp.]
MQKHNSKILPIILIIGVILLWGPVVFSILTTVVHFFISSFRFVFDFLIPLEVFPIIVLGELLISNYCAKKGLPSKFLFFLTISTVASYFLINIVATVSGLSSGTNGISDVPYAFAGIILLVVLYWVSFVWIGVKGAKQVHNLFAKN